MAKLLNLWARVKFGGKLSHKKFDGPWWIKKEPDPISFVILLEVLLAPLQTTQPQFFYSLINDRF